MTNDNEPNRSAYRLPRSVLPRRYDLRLEPDLKNFSFEGNERIDVDVDSATTTVILNSAEIVVHSAKATSASGASLDGAVSYDEPEERVIFEFPQALTPGAWTLDIAFTGILNDKLHGFYRSTFKDTEGQEHVIASTQFELTDARRAFLCWDEPDFKAKFSTTLVVDESLMAISNGPEIASEPAGPGKKAVRFGETIPMSTYLVAFVVGPFEASEPIVVRGTPLRIVSPRGKQRLANFAKSIGEFSLTFFADYFGIPYAGDKLDLIAIPDFSFGAMENLGAVTFREAALLVDENNASRTELERIADVVAHEIAHMWFGDLVTMRWWNGIWLNEAFATFMEVKAVDAWKPEWKRWESFGLERTAAMLTDALHTTRTVEYPVRRPEDADDMFDVLTYQKGGSVLRMLEQFLGEEVFRKGIAHYLDKNRYGNTETTDLWDAIGTVTEQPVRKIMDSWIFQPGFPLVSAEEQAGSIVLTQQVFKYLKSDDESPIWQVPVVMRSEGGSGSSEQRVLLGDARATVDRAANAGSIVLNAGGNGFYRARYSSNLLSSLRGSIGSMSVVERYNLVDDTWATVLAGLTSLSDFLELTSAFAGETDRNVWIAVLGPYGLLKRISSPGLRSKVQARLARLLRRSYERLGWDPKPGEDDLTRGLRATILQVLSTTAEDAGARAEAAKRYAAFLNDESSLDPNIVPAVIEIIADGGDESTYADFYGRFKSAKNPQEERRYLMALPAFRNLNALKQTLDRSLNGEIRTQDAPMVLGRGLSNLEGGPLTWSFIKENWSTILQRFPENLPPRMIGGLTSIVDRAIHEDATEFLAEHPLKVGKKAVTQILEQQRIAVEFKERAIEELAAALAGE